MEQLSFLEDTELKQGKRVYKSVLTATINNKGVLDVDTVKGCTRGLIAYPDGGCYGECYAYKIAKRYGIDFSASQLRKLYRSNKYDVFMAVKNHTAAWYRIGTAGDPSHDWDNTFEIISFLKDTGKIPIIITKHWHSLDDSHLDTLKSVDGIINTSISALDTEDELTYRLFQHHRINAYGAKSILRLVSCQFTDTYLGKQLQALQGELLQFKPLIDTPLRVSKGNKLLKQGHIMAEKVPEAIGGGKFISLHDKNIFLSHCNECPDQCGHTL